MTEAAIAGIVEQAVTRWSLVDALVIHRHSRLNPKEPEYRVIGFQRQNRHACLRGCFYHAEIKPVFCRQGVSHDGTLGGVFRINGL
jgi:molybdopterin synthase catalytic subunit